MGTKPKPKPTYKKKSPVTSVAVEYRPPVPAELPAEPATHPQDESLMRLATVIAQRQRQDAAIKQIADALGESERQPLWLLYRIVVGLGCDQALAFLQETLQVEQAGGIMLPDNSRRRTPGGVYYYLVKQAYPDLLKVDWKAKRARKKARLAQEKECQNARKAAPEVA